MSTFRLVLVPGLITLAVTLLRLVGELNGWSPTLFSSEAGGGGAVIGITWLVPLFGIYFAWKLFRSGAINASWRTLGYGALGAVAFVAVSFGATMALGVDPNQPSLATLWITIAASVVALAVVVSRYPGSRQGARRLWSDRSHPRSPGDARGHAGKLGYPLRSRSSRGTRDEPHRQMVSHRRHAPAHVLDGVHRRRGSVVRRNRARPRRAPARSGRRQIDPRQQVLRAEA